MNSNEIKELVKDIVVTPNKNNGMEKMNEYLINSICGWVDEYANSELEAASYEFAEYTDDNADDAIKLIVNGCCYINGIDGQNPYDSIYEEMSDKFGEEKVEEFLDGADMNWGSYYHMNKDDIDCLDGFQYIVARVCEDAIYDMVRETKIIKGQKFSKDDVMKFLKEAVEEFDEELDDKKQMWYRKEFKGEYDKCDIAFVSSCDARMEKIGKIEIDEDGDILIDFLSTDKMDDVNVDIDVVEMMDKIAA